MRRRWSDLSRRQHRLIVAAGIVQVALAALAWTDLARRDPEQVTGRKSVWAAVIAVNFAGPIAYWRWGRRPTSAGAWTHSTSERVQILARRGSTENS